MRRFWTESERQLLQTDYPAGDLPGLCERLNRPLKAIRSMAKRLGIVRTGTRMDPDLVAYMRDHYRAGMGPEIASRFGVQLKQVHSLAKRMGLSKVTPRINLNDPRVQARIRKLYAEGYSDTDIAEQVGCDRHTISHWRARRGYPARVKESGSLAENRWKGRIRANLEQQLGKAGAGSLGQLRVEAYRRYATDNGWPSETPPRAVQILNVLAMHPLGLCRQEIVAAIGKGDRTDRISLNRALHCNQGETSYLAYLMRLGLIVRLARQFRDPQGSQVYRYCLSTIAWEMIQRNHHEKTQHAETDRSPETDTPDQG